MWGVFGYYRVQETDGDAIAVADRTVPRDVKPRKGPKSVDYTRQDGSIGRARRLNASEYYMPLREHPDLFERFARLPERGAIDQETWLEWLHEYGVLGIRSLLSGGNPVGQQNTTTDTFSRFVQESARANRILRLFEAVIDRDGPDVEAIQKLLPEEYSGGGGVEPRVLEGVALRAIQDTVEQKIHSDCYIRFIARDVGRWRSKNLSPFTREWGFSSLLGAMWLQFMWLATVDGLKQCKNPKCKRIISTYRRADAETCSTRCRKAYERSQKRRPTTVM